MCIRDRYNLITSPVATISECPIFKEAFLNVIFGPSTVTAVSVSYTHLLPQLTGKLNTIADNFIAISDNLKGIGYASTFNKIESTVCNVQRLTEKLNRKDNSIGLLFNDPTFYQNLSVDVYKRQIYTRTILNLLVANTGK